MRVSVHHQLIGGRWLVRSEVGWERECEEIDVTTFGSPMKQTIRGLGLRTLVIRNEATPCADEWLRQMTSYSLSDRYYYS